MLQPYLYEIIRKYVNERVQNKAYPYIVSENELFGQIRKDMLETLNEMEADGLITHHENVNGIRMFRPIENETDNVQ